MGYTFNGGIHPYDGKDLSKDGLIIDLFPKGEMVYPLSQHIGAPAKAVVKKGDEVKRGQLIAEAGGFVSANIYASVSGKVKGIEARRLAIGGMCESIIIENDGNWESVEFSEATDYRCLAREEIIELIKKAGVVGMGGAGFPTHVKLSPKDPEAIDYFIINGAECEPYLTSDYRMMLERSEEIVEGIRIVLRLFKNARAIIAIEDNKPDCISLLREKVRNEEKIEVRALKTKYPQGSERQLIYAVTKRAINSSMLPADAGCVVDNIDTVYAIYDAVKNNSPLMDRVVTVTGDAIAKPCNFRTPIGCSHRELIESAGDFTKKPEKIISGGPMMGFAMFDLDTPVVKTSSAILCFSKDQVSENQELETACINCGRCAAVCPSRLVPKKLMEYAKRDDREGFNRYYGLECMECGSCSYVCPAKKQLAQNIKTMRGLELARRREEKK